MHIQIEIKTELCTRISTNFTIFFTNILSVLMPYGWAAEK